jgi:hypothetical protein
VWSIRAAAVAVLLLTLPSGAAAEICLEVNLQFTEHEPSRALVSSLKAEAASIWEPYGVRIQWSAWPARETCELLHGSFDVLVDRPRSLDTALTLPLGRTRVGDSAIEHVPIHVDHRATELMLDSLMPEQLTRMLGQPFVTSADVGRALGRVLAHEIGHVILGTSVHQPRGLMRAVFVAPDLVRLPRDSYTLSDPEVMRLRHRELALNARENGRPLRAK